MTVINTFKWHSRFFSRFVYCEPIKTKKRGDVITLECILSGPRKPNTVRIDRGMKFTSKKAYKYLQQMEIHHFYALNTEK
jgi:hypothetical protein